MADILSPKNAQSLVEMGILKPDLAEQLYTPMSPEQAAVDAPMSEPVSAQEVLEPVPAISPAQQEFDKTAEDIQNLELATRPQNARESAQMQQPQAKPVDSMKVLKQLENNELKALQEKQKEEADLEQKVAKRQEELRLAAERGIQLPKESIDSIIADRAKEQEKLLAETKQQAEAELEQQKTMQEIEQQKTEQRRAIASQEAVAQAQAEQAQKAQQKAAQQAELIKQKDAEVGQIAETQEWFKPGSLSFVLAAMLSGGAAVTSGQGGNPFLQGYQERVKRDAEKLKFTEEQKLAAEKLALEKLKEAADQQSQRITDAKTLAEIDKLRAEATAKITELQGRQIAGQGAKTGLTRDELFALYPENKDRQAFVEYGGKFYQTVNDDDAKMAREARVALDQSLPAIQGLKDISKMGVISKLTPTARANAESYQTQAIGAMRLLLLGPGTMTDTEQALIRRIITNPTELKNMIFSGAAKSNLDLIDKKLKQAYKDRLRGAGIEVPISKNEVRLENFIRKNPGISKQEAMTALINKGLWIDEQ